jgi:tetratricopeptide (TPR) repeat protein
LNDKALAIDPHDVDALNNKGADLKELGNYTGAIKFFDKTLAIDPNNAFALTNKDAILHMLGNNTTPGNATNFVEYENSTYGIKMQYPSDWSVEGGSNPAIIASFYPQRNYASVMIQIENLSSGYTPDQYLNSLMLGDKTDYKDFPDIRFSQNTTSNIVLAGHPGYLLNGTFRDPTSDALQRFTNIGTIIGDKVYSIIYYSPAETYPVYRTIYDQMIKSFEVISQNSSTINPAVSTYQNTGYGIQIQYPSDWSEQESKSSGELINVATFISPTGPDSDPTADISIYLDKLHNPTTTLNNYAHFVALADYENRPSYFHAFRLLELNTNSSILAGKPAYTIIGTYQDPSFGLQQLMETGTIIGDKAYSVQYIADAPRYADYLPIVQKMISSLVIKNSTETDIGTVPDNSTNLCYYASSILPDNLEKCYDGLCFVIWTKNR